MNNLLIPEKPKRLPRFKRAPREVGFILTRRDLEILKVVKSFRLMSSAHIQALADGSNQGILRRLQKLYHAGLLDRLSPRPRYGEGSAKLVYAITNLGARTLEKQGLIQGVTQTDWNFQNRSMHDFSVAHTLLISHVRATLSAACRLHPDLKLLFWREGPSTQDAIEVALPERYQRLPIAPDAFFGLEDAKGRTYYMLEADRATMSRKRFMRKFAAYAGYWRERRHQDKFGVRHFRVLTVTTGAERKDHLVTAAQNAEYLKGLERLFLFTQEQQLQLDDPAGIFRLIWTHPGDQYPHPLLGEAPSHGEKGGNATWKTPS